MDQSISRYPSFGSRLSSVDVCHRNSAVADAVIYGYIVVILLLQKGHEDMISREVRIEKEGPTSTCTSQDGRYNKSLLRQVKELKLSVRLIDKCRFDVYSQQTVRGAEIRPKKLMKRWWKFYEPRRSEHWSCIAAQLRQKVQKSSAWRWC